MRTKDFSSAQVAGVLCIVFGWLSLVGGAIAGLSVATSDGDQDLRLWTSAGCVVGGIAGWALWIAIGSAVTIGLELLERNRP